MNKKTIILYSSILLALLLVIGIAIFTLYSGVKSKGDAARELSKSDYELLRCVPTDALAIAQFSDFSDFSEVLTDSSSILFPFINIETSGKLVSILKNKKLSHSVLSIHKAVDLELIFIADFSRELKTVEQTDAFVAQMEESDLFTMDLGDGLRAVSTSGVVCESAKRHIESDISVLDSKGLVNAVSETVQKDRLLISMKNIAKLLPYSLNRPYDGKVNLLKSSGDWVAFALKSIDDDALSIKGNISYELGNSDFLTVLNSSKPAKSNVSKMIPKYAVSFQALPFVDCMEYINAFENYYDHSVGFGRLLAKQNELKKKTKVSPKEWANALDIKELAKSTSVDASGKSDLLYLRLGKVNESLIFKGTGVENQNDYKRTVEPFLYTGFISSLFGPYFSIDDESLFILLRDWMIIGSKKSLEAYLESDIYVNNLHEYMKDASLGGLIDVEPSVFLSYLNISEGNSYLSEVFSPSAIEVINQLSNNFSYTPSVFSIFNEDQKLSFAFNFRRCVIKRELEDNEVITETIIPKGPFKVKNSGSKKMNDFIQNDDNSFSLIEGGKKLWNAPFSSPIAGRVGQIDYLRNGRIQFLFNSGSKLYLIDRLGRMVKPFPVDLKKPVLLGPDVYDFNNKRVYNILVLHHDNTIRMYNLQGKSPAKWKDISPKETIINLPEKITVAGSSFWVVRTSVQTLIYSFYGGEALYSFEGDKMIRPDSKVLPLKDGSVQVTSYDGRSKTIKLK